MKLHPHEPFSLPCCGHKANALAHVSDDTLTLTPGDIMLCGGCGEAFIIDDQLRPGPRPTPEQLSESESTRAAQKAIRAMGGLQ